MNMAATSPDSTGESGFTRTTSHQSHKTVTHGYVHGHIHKHGDHTHIHGHIHNHDHNYDHAPNISHRHPHDNSQDDQGPVLNGTDVADPIILADSIEACNAFSQYCKDIFCEDLEDCFYGNCPDESGSTMYRQLQMPPLSAAQISLEHRPVRDVQTALPQAFSVEQGIKGSVKSEEPQYSPHPHSSPTTVPHRNSLCNTQLAKRPIFENLIRNLSYMKPNGEVGDSTEDTLIPETKRQRTESSDFEIHFPHECHTGNAQPIDPETPQVDHHQLGESLETIGSQRHDLHQSCFHTTIPNSASIYDQNVRVSNTAAGTEPDFDFFVQFNNFSRSLGMEPCRENMKPLVTEAQSIIHNSGRATGEIRDKLSPPYQYNCQWDQCNHSLDNETFLKHLMGMHIENQMLQKPNEASPSVDPKNTNYQCEWDNCEFHDEDFDALLNHLQVHKNQQNHSPTTSSRLVNLNGCPYSQQISPYALTPTSTIRSTPLSPICNAGAPERPSDSINIVSMKFVPKNIDSPAVPVTPNPVDATEARMLLPTLECQWEVDAARNGESKLCGLKFPSAKELQQHLIDDHIGSGKSSYCCRWVGCDRHNGKSFTQRQKVYRHIHVHTNYKPCMCPTCGAKFAVETTLRQHMRVHLGEKPFVCAICEKTFSTSSSLSIHHRVHTGEKPLECKWPGCKKRFSESSNLTKHMRTHYKLFKCEVCGESFDKKAHYNRHMKDHANGEASSEATEIGLEIPRKPCTAI